MQILVTPDIEFRHPGAAVEIRQIAYRAGEPQANPLPKYTCGACGKETLKPKKIISERRWHRKDHRVTLVRKTKVICPYCDTEILIETHRLRSFSMVTLNTSQKVYQGGKE